MTQFKSWLVNGRAFLLKCLLRPYINPGPRNVSEVNDLFSSSICETKLLLSLNTAARSAKLWQSENPALLLPLSRFESSSLLSTVRTLPGFCFYNFILQQCKVLLWGCAQWSVLQPAAIRKTVCVHFGNVLLHQLTLKKSPDGSVFAPLPGAHLQYIGSVKRMHNETGC